MIDRIVSNIAQAMAGISDGAVVMVGGFGEVGHPMALIDALIELDVRDLTIIANNAGFGNQGLPRLIELGRVRKLVCSFPRTGAPAFEALFRAGKIILEIVPQGTLAERIRAGGAGIPAFFTATGVGTQLGVGKEVRSFGGRQYLLEEALRADVALVESWNADRWGNLTYRRSGRNFNPIMAAAADLTIVQSHNIVELGQLDPESIVTPGVYVDRVLHVPVVYSLSSLASAGAVT